MKRFISREHAKLVKRTYMKTGLESEITASMQNRRETMYGAMFDILAERGQLPVHCAAVPAYRQEMAP